MYPFIKNPTFTKELERTVKHLKVLKQMVIKHIRMMNVQRRLPNCGTKERFLKQ